MGFCAIATDPKIIHKMGSNNIRFFILINFENCSLKLRSVNRIVNSGKP